VVLTINHQYSARNNIQPQKVAAIISDEFLDTLQNVLHWKEITNSDVNTAGTVKTYYIYFQGNAENGNSQYSNTVGQEIHLAGFGI